MSRELQTFLSTWDDEARRTAALLRALPSDAYDYRPQPGSRSLGELAWHLAEIESYMSYGISKGSFSLTERPPGTERPRVVAELAPGYERVHAAAIERLRALGEIDLDRSIPFFDGKPLPIRRILWDALLHHQIHHRGQLALVCRLAGGVPIGLYGPTREEMEAMRARA